MTVVCGGDATTSKINRERKTAFLLSFFVFFVCCFSFSFLCCSFLFFSSVFLSFPFYVSPCFSFSIPFLFSLLFFSSFPLLSPGIYKVERGWGRATLPLSNHGAGVRWSGSHQAAICKTCPLCFFVSQQAMSVDCVRFFRFL